MFLARYGFDGDPATLLAGYRQLQDGHGPGLVDLQIAIERADGLDVYDACPDEATFRAFSASAEFRAALAGVGLPTPRLEPVGEIVYAEMKQPVG